MFPGLPPCEIQGVTPFDRQQVAFVMTIHKVDARWDPEANDGTCITSLWPDLVLRIDAIRWQVRPPDGADTEAKDGPVFSFFSDRITSRADHPDSLPDTDALRQAIGLLDTTAFENWQVHGVLVDFALFKADNPSANLQGKEWSSLESEWRSFFQRWEYWPLDLDDGTGMVYDNITSDATLQADRDLVMGSFTFAGQTPSKASWLDLNFLDPTQDSDEVRFVIRAELPLPKVLWDGPHGKGVQVL
jgi:hypothetical protein